MTSVLPKRFGVFLTPGKWFFGGPEITVRTTLGSCVAITLWHPNLRIGGMCHYMLPTRGRRDSCEKLDGRYGDEAMMLLKSAAQEAGAQLHEFQTKLFGGASMADSADPKMAVAYRNISAGRELAKHYGLQVTAESLGQPGYCQVVFMIASGEVWVRYGALVSGSSRPQTMV